jgi:hypothetical protein
MKRLGHSSPAAATRYLHAVEGRDAEIAQALLTSPSMDTRRSCPLDHDTEAELGLSGNVRARWSRPDPAFGATRLAGNVDSDAVCQRYRLTWRR